MNARNPELTPPAARKAGPFVDFGLDLSDEKRGQLWRGTTLAALGALFDGAPVAVAAWALGEAAAGRAAALSPGWLTAGLVALLVGNYVLKAVGQIGTFTATYSMATDLRMRVVEHVRRLPLGFWTRQNRGSVLDLLTTQFGLYTEVFTHSWSLVVANIALPIAMAAALFALDPIVAIACVLPVPFAFLAIPWSFRRMNAATDRLDRVRGELTDRVIELVDGLETIRAAGQQTTAHATLSRAVHDVERASMASEVAAAPAILTYSLVVYSGFIAASLVAAWRVGSGALAPAWCVVTLLVAVLFVRAQASLGINLAESRFAARTLENIRALLAEPVQLDPEAEPDLVPPVVADRIRFAYPDADVPALSNVTARFPAGTVTALVGPSGSGKSTLAQLLLRLWDPADGAVRFGDVDIRQANRTHLYRHLSIVFQEVTLFAETVRENLRLARPNATDAEVEQAARRAQAHDFIMALPDGYDTVLGPEGTDLSGGQRQRISIARALMKDAPVLVLDEATASLDSSSELAVQQAIGELMADRTVIVIAHRLWTIQDVDQIVVLQQGQIVQTGTHAELVDQDGLYAQMWNAQQSR